MDPSHVLQLISNHICTVGDGTLKFNQADRKSQIKRRRRGRRRRRTRRAGRRASIRKSLMDEEVPSQVSQVMNGCKLYMGFKSWTESNKNSSTHTEQHVLTFERTTRHCTLSFNTTNPKLCTGWLICWVTETWAMRNWLRDPGETIQNERSTKIAHSKRNTLLDL